MDSIAVDWSGLEPRTVIPGFRGRFCHSSTMTFALWDIDEGAVLPLHSHPHEQVVHVLEGELEVTVDGETRVLSAGMVGIVLPNKPHSGRALTACRVMDAFSPVREDYKSGAADSILQAAAGA